MDLIMEYGNTPPLDNNNLDDIPTDATPMEITVNTKIISKPNVKDTTSPLTVEAITSNVNRSRIFFYCVYQRCHNPPKMYNGEIIMFKGDLIAMNDYLNIMEWHEERYVKLRAVGKSYFRPEYTMNAVTYAIETGNMDMTLFFHTHYKRLFFDLKYQETTQTELFGTQLLHTRKLNKLELAAEKCPSLKLFKWLESRYGCPRSKCKSVVSTGNEELVAYHFTDVTSADIESGLFWAVECGKMTILKLFTEKYPQIKSLHAAALAVKYGDLEMLTTLNPTPGELYNGHGWDILLTTTAILAKDKALMCLVCLKDSGFKITEDWLRGVFNTGSTEQFQILTGNMDIPTGKLIAGFFNGMAPSTKRDVFNSAIKGGNPLFYKTIYDILKGDRFMRKQDCIDIAVIMGNTETVSWLQKMKFPCPRSNAMIEAITRGNIDTVKYLYANSYIPNTLTLIGNNDYTMVSNILLAAINSENLEMVEIISNQITIPITSISMVNPLTDNPECLDNWIMDHFILTKAHFYTGMVNALNKFQYERFWNIHSRCTEVLPEPVLVTLISTGDLHNLKKIYNGNFKDRLIGKCDLAMKNNKYEMARWLITQNAESISISSIHYAIRTNRIDIASLIFKTMSDNRIIPPANILATALKYSAIETINWVHIHIQRQCIKKCDIHELMKDMKTDSLIWLLGTKKKKTNSAKLIQYALDIPSFYYVIDMCLGYDDRNCLLQSILQKVYELRDNVKSRGTDIEAFLILADIVTKHRLKFIQKVLAINLRNMQQIKTHDLLNDVSTTYQEICNQGNNTAMQIDQQ